VITKQVYRGKSDHRPATSPLFLLLNLRSIPSCEQTVTRSRLATLTAPNLTAAVLK
jgi:hypothetical protein